MRTSYFSGRKSTGIALESFMKGCNIQNPQHSKTILVYCWFFCTPQSWTRWFNFSFMTFVIFLFVLLIVNLAGMSSTPCCKSFEYFLPPEISHFTYLPCLRNKYVSLDMNMGIWPTVTESLLPNAIANMSCINDCGSSSCLAIKTKPREASQNGWKM